jgi:glycerate kinase
MPKRILISPNSFKECADSVTISKLMNDYLSELKNAELILKPISDGGDGFLTVCQFHFGGKIRTYSISNSYDNALFECPILYCQNRQEVYIESAEVLGLKKVPISFRNPLKLSSKGLGELLKKIKSDVQTSKIDVSTVFIGIGGTATIDMGIGMMSELGLKFSNSSGKELKMLPEFFCETYTMEYEPSHFPFTIVPVGDVENPLLGINGGVRVFGKQKGADEKLILQLENNFNQLVKLFKNNKIQYFSNKLSGAGGGISASFQIFYNTPVLHSSDFILNNLELKNFINDVRLDYLITGEGAYDHQSRFGKGAAVLLKLFESKVQNIILICGRIDSDSLLKLPRNVTPIELKKYFSTENESIINYKEGIKKACMDIIKRLNF